MRSSAHEGCSPATCGGDAITIESRASRRKNTPAGNHHVSKGKYNVYAAPSRAAANCSCRKSGEPRLKTFLAAPQPGRRLEPAAGAQRPTGCSLRVPGQFAAAR